ncbi:MAG: DUF262 domain-containing protein [Acidobacteria bacterium]|nr:DUF262 domain-containing protein [Acidobacteriota bacterium]
MPLKLERIQSELGDEQSQLAPYKIVSYPADYTLQGLYDKWKEPSIQIPPFQRQYVWTLLQASRLIESFLLGLPVPGIFFYKDKSRGDLVLIDGQQRLRSVFSFFEGRLPDAKGKFRLKGVQPEWEGKLYTELRKKDQRGFKDSVLRATIVDQVDPKDNSSIFHIFERLNTGGTSLKPQEVRNCIYSGPFNDLLLELNRAKKWRRIVGALHMDKRMRDVELILRFLALTQARSQYSKPMKNFLSDFMHGKRFASQKGLSSDGRMFKDTVDQVVECLGRKPFHIRAGLNAAVYDSVMTSFALTRKKTPRSIKSRYESLLNNESFQTYVSSSTTDVDVVKKRIALARRRLFGD